MRDIKSQVIKFKKKEAPLKTIREFLGMTQKDFSDFLGVSRESVSRWETGKHVPQLNFRQIKKLILKLREKGVDIVDIPDSLERPTP